MKKVEIEGTTKTIMYEAIDGTRFNNEAECVKYDNTALAVIKSRLKIKKSNLWAISYGCEDNLVEIITGSKDNIMMYISIKSWYYNENKEKAIKELENFDDKNDAYIIMYNCDDEISEGISKSEFINNMNKALEPNNE